MPSLKPPTYSRYTRHPFPPTSLFVPTLGSHPCPQRSTQVRTRTPFRSIPSLRFNMPYPITLLSHLAIVNYCYPAISHADIFFYFPIFADFPFCHFAALPFCHFAILPFCHFAILPFCHFAILSFCHVAILPFCHFAILPFCHFAMLPFCHFAILPFLPWLPTPPSTPHLRRHFNRRSICRINPNLTNHAPPKDQP